MTEPPLSHQTTESLWEPRQEPCSLPGDPVFLSVQWRTQRYPKGMGIIGWENLQQVGWSPVTLSYGTRFLQVGTTVEGGLPTRGLQELSRRGLARVIHLSVTE